MREAVKEGKADYIPVSIAQIGNFLETDFDRPRGGPVDYDAVVAGTDEPLAYCAFHPCRPGPGEIEVIEPDAHHVRVDEYELFRTDRWADHLASTADELVGTRLLRDEFRAAQRSENGG